MAKRPRTETSAGDASRKPPKLDSRKSDRNTASASALPAQRPTDQHVPEPPAGLSKDQRKRWRKRQRKKSQVEILDVASSRASVVKDDQPSNHLSRRSLQACDDVVKAFATTQLLPRRTKVWHDARPQIAKLGTVNLAMGNAPSAKVEQHRSNLCEDEANGHTTDAKSAHPAQESKSSASRGTFSLGTSDSARLILPAQCDTVKHSVATRKATTVPAYNESAGDPNAAFKKFDAFVNHRDSDSDNDREGSESSESSKSSGSSDGSDNGLADLQRQQSTIRTQKRLLARVKDGGSSSDEMLDRPPVDNTFIHHDKGGKGCPVESSSERESRQNDWTKDRGKGSGAAEQDSPSVQLLSQLEDSIPAEGGNGAIVATSKDEPVATTASSDSPRRANNRIKKDLSPLPFKSGRKRRHDSCQGAESHSQPQLPPISRGVFEVSAADTEDALQTLEDVSEGLLSSSRALPDICLSELPSDIAQLPFGLEPIICNTVRIVYDRPAGPADHLRNFENMPNGSSSSMLNNWHDDVLSSGSSSPLSELSRSPSPPEMLQTTSIEQQIPKGLGETEARSAAKRRRMTGRISTHFSAKKRAAQKKLRTPVPSDAGSDGCHMENEQSCEAEGTFQIVDVATEHFVTFDPAVTETASLPIEDCPPEPTQLGTPDPTPVKAKRKRKSTGKKSSYFTPEKPPLDTSQLDRVDLYNTTSSGRKARVPAGVSVAPVPSIYDPIFGVIQEKLWHEPFWLLVAVTFLNKTTGRAAVPVFWKLRNDYATPEALAEADEKSLVSDIWHLGLQQQRARRLIKMAKAWVESPPVAGQRWRALHYPLKGDGKPYKSGESVDEDADDCEGALEIGHIPGCGAYAMDSWRIFCRDVLRGVAIGYNGEGAKDGAAFTPEWKKVLPLDKELRACLRWMWLRDGWIWNCETGERREATTEEMKRAVEGEMEINDPQERRFAAQAAGVEPSKAVDDNVRKSQKEEPAMPKTSPNAARNKGIDVHGCRPRRSRPMTYAEAEDSEESSDGITETALE